MIVGPPGWAQTLVDWELVPHECGGRGEFQITRYEWENQEFPMECESCGQEMDPFCAHFEIDDGTTSYDIHQKLFGEASQ